jgi:O-antigen ligase
LFCAWIFLQCFFYSALPYLRINVGVSITPDRFVLMILLAVFAMRMATSRTFPRPTWLTALVGRLIFFFGFINLISYWIADPDASRPTLANLNQLFNIAFFPAISYFVARRLRYSHAMIRTVLVFFLVFGLYLAVTSIAEHYEASALIYPKYILDRSVGIHYGRSRGPFVDTIGNGGSLLFSFAAVCCLATFRSGPRRAALLVLALLIVAAVYFTDTRGVWLGLAVITATFVALRSAMRRSATWICCALIVGFVLGVGSKFSIREQSLFARRQNTVDNRLDNFGIAWNAFKANPAFGLGYGKFATEWYRYYDRGSSRLGIGMDDGNHSTVLGLLADVGLAGTLPWAGVIACSVLVCFGAYRHLRGEQLVLERQLAVVGLAAVEMLVVLSLTNDLRSQPGINVPTFWLVGMVSSVYAADRASKQARLNDSSHVPETTRSAPFTAVRNSGLVRPVSLRQPPAGSAIGSSRRRAT